MEATKRRVPKTKEQREALPRRIDIHGIGYVGTITKLDSGFWHYCGNLGHRQGLAHTAKEAVAALAGSR